MGKNILLVLRMFNSKSEYNHCSFLLKNHYVQESQLLNSVHSYNLDGFGACISKREFPVRKRSTTRKTL